MLKDFYDIDSPSLVRLEDFYGPKKHLIDKCIIIFSLEIYNHMLEKYQCSKIAEIGACNGVTPVYTFSHNGEEIGFYLTGIGSCTCGGNIYEVSHLTGASKFVLFGSCGSLDSNKTDGKYILPTQAYRGEGFSYYFAPASDYIDIRNSDRMAEIFTELKIPFVQGKVWTTDCMFRETVNLVNRRREEGCIAVEMEVAGVQAICDFYGLQLYDFLAAGDVFTEEGYESEGLHQANHSLDKLFVALNIIERI